MVVSTGNACTGRMQQRDLQVQGHLELATEQDPASTTKNILQWLHLVLTLCQCGIPMYCSTLFTTALCFTHKLIGSFKLICGHGLLMKTTALVLRKIQI